MGGVPASFLKEVCHYTLPINAFVPWLASEKPKLRDSLVSSELTGYWSHWRCLASGWYLSTRPTSYVQHILCPCRPYLCTPHFSRELYHRFEWSL